MKHLLTTLLLLVPLAAQAEVAPWLPELKGGAELPDDQPPAPTQLDRIENLLHEINSKLDRPYVPGTK